MACVEQGAISSTASRESTGTDMVNPGFSGADVTELRQLAKAFQTAANRLEQNRLTVGNQIKISAWVGPFAASFRLQWESQHSVRIAAAARVLTDNAVRLRKNADEQDQASRVDAGGGSGSDHGSGDSSAIVHAPTSTAGYVAAVAGMKQNDDGIRVQRVHGDDGVDRIIVYIDGSGSAHDGRLLDGNSLSGMTNGRLSWGNNAGAIFSLDSATLDGIRADVQQKIQDLGGNPDDEVMLVGFSQGGMIAQRLADEGTFKTKEVITYGSPEILNARNFGGANVLRLRHNADLVPYTEFVSLNVVTESVGAIYDRVTRAVRPPQGDELSFRAGSFIESGAHNSADYGWVASEFDKNSNPRDVAVRERHQRFQGSIIGDSDGQP